MPAESSIEIDGSVDTVSGSTASSTPSEPTHSEPTHSEPTQLDRVAALTRRLKSIQLRIPEHVRLIAVTKTFPALVIRDAYATGLRDFAENKVQEALAKQAELGDLTDVTWHFIGHVQSNKSRKVVENFDWIHSVDSLKLANRLDRQAAELNKCPSCYLQVKLANDPSKDGFELDELMAALPALDQLTHLNIVGLMVIPPNGLTDGQTKEIFERAKTLSIQLGQSPPGTTPLTRLTFQALSMGMSRDFEQAIAAGATAVRIGSGLFGRRR